MIRNKKSSNASYLSNCDSINKYTLLQAEKIPFLSKISLELASTDIYNALESMNLNDRNSEIKTRLFLVVYIFRMFQPRIRCNFVAKVKEIDKNFLLRISFSTRKEIQIILTILFTENWRPSSGEPTKCQKKNFNFKINAETFLGTERFLEKNLSNFDASKLHISCKFMFENKNFRSRKVFKKLIRNIVPFWISC